MSTLGDVKFSDCCFLTLPKDGYRLTWEVTQYCPFSCEYCFTWSSPRRKKFEVDVGRLSRKIIEFMKCISVSDVLITGGEPLAVLDSLAPFLGFLADSGVPFSFSSTLYDSKSFARLTAFRPRAINISVDPPPAAHAESSFKSVYVKTRDKLHMIEAAGIPVKITAVITPGNQERIDALLDFLSNELPLHSNIEKIAFNREYQIGHAASSVPQSKAELSGVLKKIKRWSIDSGKNVRLVNWSEFHSPLQACPAGKFLVSVMQNGDVTPCSLLYNISRSFLVGNLLRDAPEVLKERLETFHDNLGTYNRTTQVNTPKCKGCQYNESCGGGCLAAMPVVATKAARRTCKETPIRPKDDQRSLLMKLHKDYHAAYSFDLNQSQPFPEPLDSATELKIRRYVERMLVPTDLAHTMEHIDRVVALAKFISDAEGASTKITVPAAYFHDVAPREPAMHYMHTFKSSLMAGEFLKRIDEYSEQEMLHVQSAILTSSYGSHLLGYEPLTLEAKVVRDADWLEAIGARGIARVFAFNQAHGAKSFGFPDQDPETFDYRIDMNIVGPDETPILHFYTKLLRLSVLLCTNTAQRLGESRHRFLVSFLRQYKEESTLGLLPERQLSLPL